MDEHTIRSADYEVHRPLITVWLSRLFLCQIAATVITALSSISVISAVITWIARVLTIVSIVILFKLSPAHERYRKSAIFRCIVFGGMLLSLLIKISLFTLVWSILSLVAQYQEYSAHSDLVADKDPTLSRKWHSLFNWQIFGGVIAAIISIVAVLGGVFLGAETEIITSAALWLTTAVTLILEVFYLFYLHRTITLYQN